VKCENKCKMKIANIIFIWLIVLYQRYISPHKGYSCAHSALHGNLSCSSWAIQVLEKQKFYLFFPLMKRRFHACNQAYKDLKKKKSAINKDSDNIDPCPCKGSIVEGCLVCGFPFIC